MQLMDRAKPQTGMYPGFLMHSVTLLITSREQSPHWKEMAPRAAHSESVWVWVLFVNFVNRLDVCQGLNV